VINMYSKSCGTLSQFTTPAKGGCSLQDRRDLLRISQIIAVLASFLSHGSARMTCSRMGCLQSSVDDACIPTDMTLSAMRSIKISSTDFSSALCSPNIHTCNQGDRVGEQTDKVIKWTARSRQHNVVCNQFSVSLDISVCKKWSQRNIRRVK
jgi:hypothetical protein